MEDKAFGKWACAFSTRRALLVTQCIFFTCLLLTKTWPGVLVIYFLWSCRLVSYLMGL
jgi:hypothetical protein